MRRSSLIVLFLLVASGVLAQQVAVKKVEIAGQKIIVHYDLEDANINNEYQIFLYSSQNSFSTALTRVSGDVGDAVKPGRDRKIIWDVTKEIGPYRGKLSLEVRGNLYAPFVRLQHFNTDRKYKRGKVHEIFWKANSQNPVHIELFRGTDRVHGVMNQPNNGVSHFLIPGRVKPGKDYRIRFTDSRNTSDVIYTGYFRIAPKIPLLVKILPLLGGGAAAVLLAPDGGKEDPGPRQGEGDDIALPIFPGG